MPPCPALLAELRPRLEELPKRELVGRVRVTRRPQPDFFPVLAGNDATDRLVPSLCGRGLFVFVVDRVHTRQATAARNDRRQPLKQYRPVPFLFFDLAQP